jgi:hypothetical protein
LGDWDGLGRQDLAAEFQSLSHLLCSAVLP